MSKKKSNKLVSSLLAARVRRAERNAIENGARRTPNGMLSKEAADALERLVAANYAPSETKVVARALVEADKRQAAKIQRRAIKKTVGRSQETQ